MKKLLFALPFLLFACKTSINPNKESFYCKINGKEFIPEKDNSPIGGVGSSPLKVERDIQYNWLYINALNNAEYVTLGIKLNPNEDITVKEYILSNDLKGSAGGYYYNINANASDREKLISITGKISITKIENRKFWGTFEFKTKSAKTNQEYIISEGQFNNLSF